MFRFRFNLFLMAVLAVVNSIPTIDQKILGSMKQNEKIDIRLSMKGESTTIEVLTSLKFTSFANRSERLDLVHKVLLDRTNNAQADILNFLSDQLNTLDNFSFKQMWISNAIIIRGADRSLIEKLMTRLDIDQIQVDKKFPLEKLHDKLLYKSLPLEGETWGLIKTQVPQVWDAGFMGQGIVVANIDSGVRGSHDALRGNFRQEFGWHDPDGLSPIPVDEMGHGTHTIGSVAGQNGIGMAPNATWIACRGCVTECSFFAIEECCNWLACPDTDGHKECGMAPHVISNSWGVTGGDSYFDDIILAWRAGGIIPIFSAGNDGPECSQLLSPSDNVNVISVAATTDRDDLASFSSPGPSLAGIRKPDISAPGENILSAAMDDDESYISFSGTSMACPHVSGLTVLMLSSDPTLSYEQIKKSLEMGADTLIPSGNSCGGISDDEYPNNHAGYGRINARRSVLERVIRY